MFAREFHTVAVDGCHKLCATKAIERYSGMVEATVDVEGLFENWGMEPPASRRELDGKDREVVGRVAWEIAKRIDSVEEARDA
jgi:uncharacterized metal-binding protein